MDTDAPSPLALLQPLHYLFHLPFLRVPHPNSNGGIWWLNQGKYLFGKAKKEVEKKKP